MSCFEIFVMSFNLCRLLRTEKDYENNINSRFSQIGEKKLPHESDRLKRDFDMK